MPNIPRKQRKRYYIDREAQGRRKRKNRKVYNSAQWKRIRKIQLNQMPICEQCDKEGLTVPARVVDHITPINEGGQIYSLDNLQSLCDSCHNKKSGKEAHK